MEEIKFKFKKDFSIRIDSKYLSVEIWYGGREIKAFRVHYDGVDNTLEISQEYKTETRILKFNNTRIQIKKEGDDCCLCVWEEKKHKFKKTEISMNGTAYRKVNIGMLHDAVKKFQHDNYIIDIKYESCSSRNIYSALITYEERKEEDK